MISPRQLQEILRLLGQGRSQRAVARELGIARGTVGAAATGRHSLQTGREPTRADRARPTQRCPGCGRLVIGRLPCLACRLEGSPVPRLLLGLAGCVRVGLELEPPEHARYVRVRRRRRRAELRRGNRAEQVHVVRAPQTAPGDVVE